MDRIFNYLFSFLLVVVFISAASVTQQWFILLGIVLSALFSLLAFILQRLSLDGMYAAIVIGTFVFGLGGWGIAALLLLFFVSSSLLNSINTSENYDIDIRRNGSQVWANGFWLVTCLVFMVFYDVQAFFIGAIGALSTATADTWATELGSQKPDNTYLITNFDSVSPGTDGGVSLQGTFAAVVGSLMIAGAALYIFSLPMALFITIFAAGFLGCLMDSYFGAIFQRNNRSVTLPVLDTVIRIDNNLVNGISTGTGALLAITLKLFLG